jgi:malate dehydrogenase (oxaloacetate-decarboxylating)
VTTAVLADHVDGPTPRGAALLADRYRNKGTAFTLDERDRFGLHGLLPPAVEEIATQLERVEAEYHTKQTDLGRHIFLRRLQELNSVLFYRFLSDHLPEVLPVIYTPTVGLACEHWSRIYRREHGCYVGWSDRNRVDELLGNAAGDAPVDVIVVTDGERILGLGDLGVGGMGIPIGKLALYTAAGGIDPARTLPVMLDVGTNNEALLSDPLYLGSRSRRLPREDYDELVDAFVDAVARRFPGALLQWEDFAQGNAGRLLARHRDRLCSFNDDIQGTAAVTTAAIGAGLRIAGTPVAELRLVVVGAGSAGTGIAEQAVRLMVAAGLTEAEALGRCWLVDRAGLLHDRLEGLAPFQARFAHPWGEVATWDDDADGQVELLDVVRQVAPHAVVAVTGQRGLLTEDVVRAQAAAVHRPIVLPLSNPTLRAEAVPTDVLEWTDGRALLGTGSPFEPVRHGTRTYAITQVNNVYVFPGVGLATVAVGCRRVSDGMLTAAAAAVGELAPAPDGDLGGVLLPPVSESRAVARHVARAVALQAITEGLAPGVEPHEVDALLDRATWVPAYRDLA